MTASDRPRPPSVERVLGRLRATDELARDAEARRQAVREVIADERARLADGAPPRSIDDLATVAQAGLDGRRWGAPVVINATGVLIHTNLGRAAWAWDAQVAALNSTGPVLLELDRATGRRGARYRLAEDHLVALTGAEDALITNNNAAAVALAVGLAGRGGRVAVSRGELVEIGGGVRIPEILRRAGIRLVEVGTTNRTRAEDFEAVLADASARVRLVLRVHPSNFVQSGFTEVPDATAVADAAHRHGAIVVDDLGSGALLPTERFGLAHEPTPRERLGFGADIVTFSGDKLVGGPQAGLVVGRRDLVTRMRRDPLARAMRPDKTTLAGVAATLGLYRAGLAEAEIPAWRAIAASEETLHARATVLAARIGDTATVVALQSRVGGGALPGEVLPSWGLTLSGAQPDRLLARLRAGEPCVIGRIEDDRAVLDLRTVEPESDEPLGAAIAAAIGAAHAG